ncbi:hypothetical protein LOTGIDRAFT_133409 [Lottia gigantea]|uniref:Carboxylesterase type B domain-containing protein n=1 Tax=Lottia gigantea TaxID=225164 RepID=V3ZRG4_LOTGI|nr:hypothetical protein LOTGIDRAFT_133409 [Lottia gigantea]ESO83466.1 hypothetical protein LOTGIDRAFT_133409 [Lottia gigantea]
MVGTNSAEGGQAFHRLGFYQDSHNFDLDKGVPREVFKNLFVKSIIRDYFNGSKDVEQELLIRYSGLWISDIEQARKLVALFGDFMQHAPSVKTLRHHAKLAAGKKTYQYYFAHEPTTTNRRRPWFQGADHAEELTFVFGPEVMYPPGTNVSKEERQFSRTIMKYWSNFAKTG